MLVSEDEARQTVEVDDMYIIRPNHPWWRSGNWVNARGLPEDFRFASDNNTRWLSMHELLELIAPGAGVESLAPAILQARTA